MAGNIQLRFSGVVPVLPHVRSGRLRGIAIGSAKRYSPRPDVPTISEAGLPGYAVESLYAVVAPAGTPRAIIGKINAGWVLNNFTKDGRMQKRIAMAGAGALGGYIGGNLAHQGFDVTFIDMWQENLDAIRTRGLELDGVTAEEKFTVKTAQTLHLDKIQDLGKSKPVDIAFISVKSYDTERVTHAIKPFLAPDGYVVSLQNCINEDAIATIVGADRTLGVIASIISVELYEAGRIRRMAAKGGDQHTVFRVGEVNGGVTDRVNELVSLFSLIDSTKATTNLLGERWSKLIQNSMRNGVAAATGLTSGECDRNEAPRRFAIKVGGEGVRVAQALGIKLVGLGGLAPARLVSASEGDAAALAEVEAIMVSRTASNPRAGIQRPSMAQDMQKGRRTEIEYMNGYIADQGRQLGIATPSNLKLVDLVLRVQRGELKPSAQVLDA